MIGVTFSGIKNIENQMKPQYSILVNSYYLVISLTSYWTDREIHSLGQLDISFISTQ